MEDTRLEKEVSFIYILKSAKKEMPTLEFVVQLFFFLKNAYDNFKDNRRDSHLLVKRLSALEDPLLKFQSHELSVSKESLDTLEEVLQGVKQFLDEYNTRSMWMSCKRAIFSGKYAQDFARANQLVDRALQTVGLSLNISNEERRQQDLDEVKKMIGNLSRYIISDVQSHSSTYH